MKQIQSFIIASFFALSFAPAIFSGEPNSFVEIGPLERVKADAFVQLLSDATGRPFAVAGDVDASFTVIVPGNNPIQLSSDDVYAFGLSVLASAGLSVVEDGDSCRIVRLPEGGGLSVGASSSDTNNARGLVTRVFRLKNVGADDVRRVLEGGGGKKGWIAVLESSNHLVVTDTERTLARVAELVEELDQPGLARTAEIVQLVYADAESLAAQLNTIAAQSTQSEGGRLSQRLQSGNGAFNPAEQLRSGIVVPSPHANALVLVGQEAQLKEFKALISKLDVDAPTGRGNLHMIPLQYLKAEDLAKNISALLEKSAAKAADGKSVRRVAVESSPVNNALIIDASPNDFAIVRDLIAEMDKQPGQVHVSVMIAEVTDSDGFTWNPQLTALDVPSKNGDSGVSAGSRFSSDSSSLIEGAANGILPQGITAAIAHKDRNGNLSYPGIISIEALNAKSNVKILSETSLQAQNNVESEVKIVDDIPYLKSQVEGSGSDRDFIQNVDRMEVGVTLKFTPYIVPNASVRMLLEPTIASVISTGTDSLNPTIAKRSAKTTVTVPDSETIVIAGLTRTSKQVVKKRIPILGSIPILGWLFRYESESEEKTNLLIFVTPTIITAPVDARATTMQWRIKTGITNEPASCVANEPAENK